jgi:hypothetical protein
MEEKIKQIKEWLGKTQNEYDNYSILRNRIIAAERHDKYKEMHTEITTLKKILKILESN